MRGMFFGGLASVLVMVLMLLPDVPLVSGDCTQAIAGNYEGVAGSPAHPAVDGRDNYVYAVFTLYNQKYEMYNVAIRYSANGGQSWGPTYWVSESPRNQDFSDIKVVPAPGAGVIHIVWQEKVSDGDGNQYWVVKHRAARPGPIYDPAYYPYYWTSVVQLSNNGYGSDAKYPKVSAGDEDDEGSGDNSWVHVTWQEDVDGTTGGVEWGIKYREGYVTYNVNSNPMISVSWSQIYSLSSDGDGLDAVHPAIASSSEVLGQGGPVQEHWYVVWERSGWIEFVGGMSVPGNPPIMGPVQDIIDTGTASEPDVSASFNEVDVVWQEPEESQNAGEVFMRKSTDYGNTWNPAFRVTPLGYPAIDLSTWGPAIDTDSTRTYIVMVCYTDNTETDNEVYYSVYDHSSQTWVKNEWNPYPPYAEIYYPNAKENYPDVATELQYSGIPGPSGAVCGLVVFENTTATQQQIVYTRYNPTDTSHGYV